MNEQSDVVMCAQPQEAPRYYGYWRYNNCGYSDVTRCVKCGNTGLREDCNPVNPCKHCGGNVVEDGAAKWVFPTYSGMLFWKKRLTEGYWLRA